MKHQSRTRNTVGKIKRKHIYNGYYDNRINDDNENDNLIVASSTISVNMPLESIVHSTIYTTPELLPRNNKYLSETEQMKVPTVSTMSTHRLGEDYPEEDEGIKNITTPTPTPTPTSIMSSFSTSPSSNFNIFAIVGTIVAIIVIIIILITIIQKSIFIKENGDNRERNRFSFFWRFMKHSNNRDKLPIMTSISNNTDNSSERRLSLISSRELRDSRVQQFDLIDNNNDPGNEITNKNRTGKFEGNETGIYNVINEDKTDKIEIASLASCGSDTIDLRPLESPNWDECME